MTAQTPDKVHSVSEINRDIRLVLERGFQEIWVEGEVSNLRTPGSGHHYFTLKDAGAQLSCVMFRNAAQRSNLTLQNGQKILVRGDITVYESRGQYQIVVQTAQLAGHGELQAQFEALKLKLSAEGLFDSERKKRIPFFPKTIAVVTSPTGAAIQDILKVMSRRAPWIHLIIAPVRVQGEEAGGEIARAIRYLSSQPDPLPHIDTLIVARGGGSIEDLWAFNEEIVARAIYDCPIPVLSGVGHEIDFTISDFVADRREPTPSAAAEAAVPDGETLLNRLDVMGERLDNLSDSFLRQRKRLIDAYRREMEAREPARKIQNWAQSMDYLEERMENAIDRKMENYRSTLSRYDAIIANWNPERDVKQAREHLDRLNDTLLEATNRTTKAKRERIAHLQHLLLATGPDKTLKRGFSMTLDAKGNPVNSAKKLKKGQKIKTRFADGEVVSTIDK